MPNAAPSFMPAASPHYLVITVGSTGDLHPFVSLASQLQALGRTVTVLTHSYHAARVAAAGLRCIALGNDEDYLALLRNPDIWHPQKSFAALLANYADGLREIGMAISQLGAPASSVVICHPFAVPAAAIAREQGLVAHVVAGILAPSNLKTCHDPLTIGPLSVPSWVPMSWRRAYWRFVERGWIDPVALGEVNTLRSEQGLAPVMSFMDHLAHAPDLSLALFPEWFAPTQPDWPQPLLRGDFPLFEIDAGQPLPDALAEFLAAGEPPLVFTAGTGNLHAARFFACALAATQRLGKRALLLSRERAQIPADLPASVLWQPYVPLAQLLPHAAALVHHGGIGTTAEALRAGIPQLITPFAWDQFDNGARIAALGCGLRLPASRLSPAQLARTLGRLLAQPAFRQQATAQRRHFDPAHAGLAPELKQALTRLP